ncbi:phosphoglucosamine mutase [Intrasporangium calvum]|uniref:Phosphoglucosamine mutase n=1 Tax=Intrasporangium calvum (strain ATCC 23552 / DSM 43043 / JCM 3097 / NBRC 12989 / NCIMB 10167 / NRRL B-3866 / 7 KIP) TaxID=710696 RepID=E6S932_INTC7|nr:phosphoglucosamine mutase [Intrasporangium calvum]ADU49207.1 phosphoglucosamine mutase [Intrasporangium calvum DSM 43043]
MARLFGTDGVRGIANQDITAELALDLSVAAAHVLGEVGEFNGHRPVAIVGRDPRASGEFLAAATMAGLASAGVDVLDAGVLPTPAIAYLVADRGADLGAMLSASHNPMPDNGIKFFARGGHKLADELEDAIEKRLGEQWQRPTGADVGRILSLSDGADRYVTHLLSVVAHRLDRLHVVLDTAHGAASVVAPRAFAEAGAKVTVIGNEPDGININDGFGSTHLGRLQEKVVEVGADLGLAFDGDADRCLAVDAAGEEVDGDQIMAILALSLKEQGTLRGDTLVATVMSNLGMIQALAAAGIKVLQTAVGDRYVLEGMKDGGYTLGGEQSGHVVMLDHGTTGDGTLTGLMIASRVASTGRTLADLAAVMRRFPQVLINVKGVDKSRLESSSVVSDAVRLAEAELGESGRVLLRKSGTEPVVRVMVEAADGDQAHLVAGRLVDVVKAELAL